MDRRDPEPRGEGKNGRARLLLANRSFVFFTATRLFNILGIHALSVAVGWQVYRMTGDPFDLGLVGFAQFAPVLALFLLAGYASDLFDRRAILVICNVAHAVVAGLLLAFGMSGATAVGWIFAILVLNGAGRGFFHPASQAILPNIVAPHLFPNAVAYATSMNKLGMLVGPAAGGVLIAVIGDWVYLAILVSFVVAAFSAGAIAVPLTIRSGEQMGLGTIFQGFDFIRRKKIVLGAITIDLLAVLFGGVMGLLPVFASDILHVGPEGLGVMRATPAIGAIAVGIVLAQLSSPGRMGPALFASLAAFAGSIIVFSMSTWFWLSLLALAIYGAADMVSVYVRHTLVQVATPDEMRGRVSAVNSVSINASNELGDFRAGVMAAWIGTAPAVLVGGIVTLFVGAVWWRSFPELARVDRLDSLSTGGAPLTPARREETQRVGRPFGEDRPGDAPVARPAGES
ncbi:MAG: MFS transporter [Propylenella sp.]